MSANATQRYVTPKTNGTSCHIYDEIWISVTTVLLGFVMCIIDFRRFVDHFD